MRLQGARTLEEKLKHIRRARSIASASNISNAKDNVFPLNFEVRDSPRRKIKAADRALSKRCSGCECYRASLAPYEELEFVSWEIYCRAADA